MMLAPPVPLSIAIPLNHVGATGNQMMSPKPKSQNNCPLPMMSPIVKTPIYHSTISDLLWNRKTDDNVLYSIPQSLRKQKYIPLKEISQTLQGSVWKALTKDGQKCIIKITSIALHNKSMAIINGKLVKVQENIIKEASVLKFLTMNSPPNSLAHYIDFYMDEANYFLVMEDGGRSLFDLVEECHQCIVDGILDITEWQRFCKIAIKQMVEILYWMHNTMHCCHLDISLENFVISDVMAEVNNKNKIQFSDDFQVKLIDFGLSEVFEKVNKKGITLFKCSKYVGKTAYKCPEMYGKQRSGFDARLADVWSFGICLFSMLTGGILCEKAHKKDVAFVYVMNGRLLDVLESYNRLSYVNSTIFHLMSRILKYEENRFNMKQIKNHQWLTQ